MTKPLFSVETFRPHPGKSGRFVIAACGDIRTASHGIEPGGNAARGSLRRSRRCCQQRRREVYPAVYEPRLDRSNI